MRRVPLSRVRVISWSGAFSRLRSRLAQALTVAAAALPCPQESSKAHAEFLNGDSDHLASLLAFNQWFQMFRERESFRTTLGPPNALSVRN
jgi:hypothetical protein